jgi:starch-binding outer membrane protein, SusD/RagB family
MRLRTILPLLLLALVAAGCKETLTVEPVNEVPEERAITDAATARAAVAGAYDALQDDVDVAYYSGDFTIYGDLSSDDVEHSGTFDTYLFADQNQLRPDNATIEDIWSNIYEAISRVNIIIEKLPNVPGLDAAERDDLLGQVYFLRALNYHNLVKLWGDVPLVTQQPAGPSEAAQVSRAPVTDVYTQILSDLAQARALITNESDTRAASRGAVFALLSRVYLYQQNWDGVLSAADSAEDYGYTLATNFSDLFSAEGSDTPEDVFRLSFTVSEANYLGYYYLAKGVGGRYEVAPTCSLVRAFDADVTCTAGAPVAGWSPTDARAAWSIGVGGGEAYGKKFPTGIGDEDLHVIRFAEVILNRAEALARLGSLAEAVTEYNKTRIRAGLTPDVLGVTVANNQQAVLDAVWNERRLELAFEGFRWPDIVRTGRAIALLNLDEAQNPRTFQVLYPIPQPERDTSPNVVQNPGY